MASSLYTKIQGFKNRNYYFSPNFGMSIILRAGHPHRSLKSKPFWMFEILFFKQGLPHLRWVKTSS